MNDAFDFTRDVPHNGYAWWYLDAVSDDGRFGATIIVFIGSVFSPYYRRSRGRARARSDSGVDPRAFCAFNVALYGPSGRWAMTERGAGALETRPGLLAIGPSRLEWDGARLLARIHERAAPMPRPLRGQIEIQPAALTTEVHALDAAGRHLWHPIAPLARARLSFTAPDLDWQGHAYIDHNRGSRPLEADFIDWQWSRAAGALRAVIHYDARRCDQSRRLIALGFDDRGHTTPCTAAPAHELPPTRWRLARAMRAEAGARLAATLEDAPFYSRSLVDAALDGAPVQAIHESLSMTRFERPWVQAMLPFRMPRRARWKHR